MESKDNNIINKMSGSIENTHRSVDVLPSFRRLIKRKYSKRGNAVLMEEKTGVLRQTFKNVIDGKRIQRKSLETLVKYFKGDDANVDDYIKEAI
ncbi:hypothetical protein F0919_18120 [Taibaiella lutea]|uniref:Uncharacterized protein n=1 Tax=Taibaiella lutea TaxID=2608001 RepID=A0A5M6CC35_9BACT|nr:hypothetical protein [Taibaiella lutea]KAA5532697.1 hypothetical protein F0919_18120 [Taibaiella lutea]